MLRLDQNLVKTFRLNLKFPGSSFNSHRSDLFGLRRFHSTSAAGEAYRLALRSALKSNWLDLVCTVILASPVVGNLRTEYGSTVDCKPLPTVVADVDTF